MELPQNYEDPFTILMNGLWSVFESNTLIASMVRNSNRVKYNTVLGLKDTVQQGDLPEMVIVPVGHMQEDMGTSGTSRITETYRVFISTGDKRAVYIHALQWELYRCLETFNASVAGTLLYNGKRFIELLKIASADQSTTNPELNRGINGWCASWEFSVGMFFSRNDLLFNVGE